MTKTLPILIVGSSLAGLATAALLRARGHETVVLESGDTPGHRDRLEPAWVPASKEAAIATILEECRFGKIAGSKAQFKISADRAGVLGTGTMGFVMKTESTSALARVTARMTLSSSEVQDNRLSDFYKTKGGEDIGDLLNALAGPESAELRTSPRAAFALAREVVIKQEGIVVFEGGCASLIENYITNAGTIRTNCKVEQLMLGDGHARGVILQNGDEIAGSAVVLAEPAVAARALFTTEDWSRVSAEERWKFEAATPRPALRAQFALREKVTNPIFIFSANPPAWMVAAGREAWVKVGAAVDSTMSAESQRETVRSAAAVLAKFTKGVDADDANCKYQFCADDEPIAALAGGRERPHHRIDGFDNLLIVGESTDAPGFGLERTLGSARIAARQIG